MAKQRTAPTGQDAISAWQRKQTADTAEIMHFGMWYGELISTYDAESERLVRLPLYYGMKPEEQKIVLNAIASYYTKEG